MRLRAWPSDIRKIHTSVPAMANDETKSGSDRCVLPRAANHNKTPITKKITPPREME